MFEDSTFESGEQDQDQERSLDAVHGRHQCAILVLLILIPLIYPEALPRQLMATF